MFHGAQKAFTSCIGLRGVHVIQDGRVVCLRGKINPTMFLDLLRQRGKIEQRPYVIVSGIGGYLDSSIYIARLLDTYDPVSVAGDMCASACAQILFLMGRHRVVLHCADLAIHRGLDTVPAILATDRDDEFKQRLIANISRFKKFYRDRHIDLGRMTTPPPDIQKRLDAGKIVFWPWSINQLRSFGVRGIISQNNPDKLIPHDYAQRCLAGKK